jgi:hypothetical protein
VSRTLHITPFVRGMAVFGLVLGVGVVPPSKCDQCTLYTYRMYGTGQLDPPTFQSPLTGSIVESGKGHTVLPYMKVEENVGLSAFLAKFKHVAMTSGTGHIPNKEW